ncbi:hypothetical protein BJX96DRAFT_153415, partial [Aspergillus floccosus]
MMSAYLSSSMAPDSKLLIADTVTANFPPGCLPCWTFFPSSSSGGCTIRIRPSSPGSSVRRLSAAKSARQTCSGYM